MNKAVEHAMPIIAPRIVGIKQKIGFIERASVTTTQLQAKAAKTHHQIPMKKPATSITRTPKVETKVLKSKSKGSMLTSGLRPTRELTIFDWSKDTAKDITEII